MSDSASSPDGGSSRRRSKVQRWLDLIATLLRRRAPATAEEILTNVPWYAERWIDGDDTSRNNVRRRFELDKEELRALGIAIKTIPDSRRVDGELRAGYRLARHDFYLPVLRLVSSSSHSSDSGSPIPGGVEIADQVARLAIEALRHVTALPGHVLEPEARSALRKLTFDLDRFAFPSAPILIAPRSTAVARADTLRMLLDATRVRRRVRFQYHGIARDETTHREVAPYALLFQNGRWYLVGHDSTRTAIRTFRVSRILDLDGPDRSRAGEYEVPDDFDIGDYRGRTAWELGDEPSITARVDFDPGPALHAQRCAWGELVEDRADGTATRAFIVHDADAFARWILAFQGGARIVEPSALAEIARDLARQVAEGHTPLRTTHSIPPQRRRHRPRRRSGG